MNAMAFDTLKAAKDLEAAGFAAPQAEALANTLNAAMTSGVATKEDIAKLDGKYESVTARLEAKIDTATASLRGEITLLKWMMGVLIAANIAILLRLFAP